MNIASHQITMYSVTPGRWLDFAAAMDARAQPQHCRRLAGVCCTCWCGAELPPVDGRCQHMINYLS